MVAINPAKLESHQDYSNNFNYNFPLVVDKGSKVAAAYGVKKLLGGIQRTVFLIDKQGKIAWAQEGMPETSEILAAIDAMPRAGHQ